MMPTFLCRAGIKPEKKVILPKEKECDFFMKKEKKVDMSGLSREEKLKYEIAEELGLLDRVLENGWKTLSAKETGRIGGLVTKRRRSLNREEQQDQ